MNRLAATLQIGLSASALTVQRTRRWPRTQGEVIAGQALSDATPEQALQALREVLAQEPLAGMRARVVLGNDWGRLFMAVAPRNAESLRDCEAAAQMRFRQLYGEPEQPWALRADWDARRPFLACAVPQGVLDGVRGVCAECRLALVGIELQFIAAWNRWCRSLGPGDWFGNADADKLTLAVLEHGQLVAVRWLPLTGEARADAAWLGVQLRREALRLGVTVPARLRACGNVPAAWLAPDAPTACARLDEASAATHPDATEDGDQP